MLDTPLDGRFGNRFSKRPTVTVLIPTPTSANEPISPIGNRTYVRNKVKKQQNGHCHRERGGERKRRRRRRGRRKRLPYEYPVLLNSPTERETSRLIYSVCKRPFSSPPPSPSWGSDTLKIWI